MKTEPRQQGTCIDNFVKFFGHVDFEICERTGRQADRQTNRHAGRNKYSKRDVCTAPYNELKNT